MYPYRTYHFTFVLNHPIKLILIFQKALYSFLLIGESWRFTTLFHISHEPDRLLALFTGEPMNAQWRVSLHIGPDQTDISVCQRRHKHYSSPQLFPTLTSTFNFTGSLWMVSIVSFRML